MGTRTSSKGLALFTDSTSIELFSYFCSCALMYGYGY